MDIIGSCENENVSSICFYIYDPEKESFYPDSKYIPYENATILNLIANNFNEDLKMDLIVTLEDTNTKEIRTEILLNNPNTGNYDLSYTINNSSKSVLLADIADQRGVNLLFYENGVRYYLTYVNGIFVKSEFSKLVSSNNDVCDATNAYINNEIESINSNGFIDIDGDCLNDILINSIDKNGDRYLEIWKAIYEQGEIRYCLSSSNVYPLDKSLGLFTIADIDRNGMPDLVFPILNSSPPEIMVAHNKIKLKYDWTENYCDNHKPIKLDSSDASNIKINAIFEIPNIGNSTDYTSFIKLSMDENLTFYESENLPAYLRFYDINQDSYPDLAVLLKDKNTNKTYPYIFISQGKEHDDNYNGELNSRRNFYINDVYSFKMENAQSISFFDFKDDSKLDIILADSNGNLYGYLNQYVYDRYTMKSILLYKENCYNCVALGSTKRFITTNIDGSRRMDLSIQSPQAGVMGCLSMPFAYLGIGRSNNYIENFHTISGMEYKRACNDKVYTPVIPNSQLVIYSLKTGNKCDWKVDLIVKPTQNMRLLIIVIIIMIVIMASYATWLQMKEMEEDNIENREIFATWFG